MSIAVHNGSGYDRSSSARPSAMRYSPLGWGGCSPAQDQMASNMVVPDNMAGNPLVHSNLVAGSMVPSSLVPPPPVKLGNHAQRSAIDATQVCPVGYFQAREDTNGSGRRQRAASTGSPCDSPTSSCGSPMYVPAGVCKGSNPGHMLAGGSLGHKFSQPCPRVPRVPEGGRRASFESSRDREGGHRAGSFNAPCASDYLFPDSGELQEEKEVVGCLNWQELEAYCAKMDAESRRLEEVDIDVVDSPSGKQAVYGLKFQGTDTWYYPTDTSMDEFLMME